MADKLSVTRSTYRNWEEKTEPDLATIKTIAGILEVPVWTLLKGVLEPGEIEKPSEVEGQSSLVNDPETNYDAGAQTPSIDVPTLETLVEFLMRLRLGEYDGRTVDEVTELFWRERTAKILNRAKSTRTGKDKTGKVKSR